jgi:hypothetical protein
MIEDLSTLEPPERPNEEQDIAQRRRQQFAQANASLALEGMRVDVTDLAIQEKIAAGELTPDQAVAFYVERAKSKGAS